VQWDKLACEYEFVLVTKPFDPSRLAHLPTSVAAENDSATLLPVHKPARCEAALPANLGK
jgi:hypothetical protein